MNKVEKKMVSILRDLRQTHGALAVKAEFEAEGTRLEDLLRLKEICMLAEVGLILKIGGCESVRDILESRVIGVNYLVAPMIESSYALYKYLLAVEKFIPEIERKQMEILCNIESLTACQKIDEILNTPGLQLLNGIAIERVDLCFSNGMGAEDIDHSSINQLVSAVMAKAKKKGLKCVIGGGVSANSLPFFGSKDGLPDRFETRKVCFDRQRALADRPEEGILKALGFEWLWLNNKYDHSHGMAEIDRGRIHLIEKQYLKKIENLIEGLKV